MWTNQQYDVIVVGAGPAGSTFSKIAASNGLSVLLLDRKTKIGRPVRCGEGVVANELLKFHDPQPEWISTIINKFRFVGPNGSDTTINLSSDGIILNREVFDHDLVQIAEKEGTKVITNANVDGLLIDGKKVIGVRGICRDEAFKVTSKLVVGADGVESRIGYMAGIKTKLSLRNIDSGYQKTISGIEVDPEACSFYLSDKLAPQGYLWIFPKGKNIANVGIGISGKAAMIGDSAKTRLNKFIDSNFPDHEVESITVGGIPLSKSLKELVTDGLMLIGDAGRTVNPLSGGGIILGMKSAAKAAKVAVKVLKSGLDATKSNLLEYQVLWMSEEGKQIDRIYRIKEAVYKLTDKNIDNIIAKVSRLPTKKRNLARLFTAAIPQKPSLLIDVVKVFTGY